MRIFECDPQIGLLRVDPTTSDELLRVRVRQFAHAMSWVQDYYESTLGLYRVDTDPRPHPDDPGDAAWRTGRMRLSGPVQHTGLCFIGAFALGGAGDILAEDGALLGLLILKKPDGLCTVDGHRPTEIIEFDVREDRRGQGLGRALLQFGMQDVHPQDAVVLDVSESNLDAQRIYNRYGFEIVTDAPSIYHEVFAEQHLLMRTDGSDLRARLELPGQIT